MRKIVVGLLLLWMAAPALAREEKGLRSDERGWLAGIGLGVIDIEFDRGFEGTSAEYMLFGGYRLNRYFAAEISYQGGGEVERERVTIETSSTNISVLASLPLGKRFSLYGRIGAAAWRWEAAGVERDGTDLFYAAGAAVNIARIELKLEAGASEWDEDMSLIRGALQVAWRF